VGALLMLLGTGASAHSGARKSLYASAVTLHGLRSAPMQQRARCAEERACKRSPWTMAAAAPGVESLLQGILSDQAGQALHLRSRFRLCSMPHVHCSPAAQRIP
jgi:hypothetical protein